MTNLDRYTPEICATLRHIAEHHSWAKWAPQPQKLCAPKQNTQRETVLRELELTYHLHVAADAAGLRAGLPPMPPFPVSFADPDGLLDPGKFIEAFEPFRSTVG
jgi:hypothetical protein